MSAATRYPMHAPAQICRVQSALGCSNTKGTCTWLPPPVGATVQALIHRQAEAEAERRARQFEQLNGGVEDVLRIGSPVLTCCSATVLGCCGNVQGSFCAANLQPPDTQC